MPSLPFSRVALIGPGLLGGSVALAIRAQMPECELSLWARRAEVVDYALKHGLAQRASTDLQAMVQGAELVILATPIGAFEQLSRRMMPSLNPDALVTDIGSVKAYVHRSTGQLLTERGFHFVGSHPMAGSEKQGIEHADAQMLVGAKVALTNEHGVAEPYVQRLEDFWRALSCTPCVMRAKSHDQTVSRISHVPHALAALCARAAKSEGVDLNDLQQLAASGFRDTTRVSEGPTDMWADILWENDVAERETLAFCLKDIKLLIHLLERQDKQGLAQWLEEGKQARRAIRKC